MEAYSNSYINKVGKRIREEDSISDEMLDILYQYRSTFQDDVFRIFAILCEITKNINPSILVTNRIKKYNSIVDKLKRIPTMQLSTMGDIGGCRCITENEDEIFQIIDKLKFHPDIYINKENSYLNENKKNDGYQSYHLYINLLNSKNRIEIQLRSNSHHDWATLVEITDLLFETNSKTSIINNEFTEFHKLLSERDKLEFDDITKIIKFIINKNLVKKLRLMFSQNLKKITQEWLTIEKFEDYNYFLIEVQDEKTYIISYSNQIEAEKEYLNKLKKNKNANLFLTFLVEFDFEKLSKGYPNYILINHNFLIENLYYFIYMTLYSKSPFRKLQYFYEYFKICIFIKLRAKKEIKIINDELKKIDKIEIKAEDNFQNYMEKDEIQFEKIKNNYEIYKKKNDLIEFKKAKDELRLFKNYLLDKEKRIIEKLSRKKITYEKLKGMEKWVDSINDRLNKINIINNKFKKMIFDIPSQDLNELIIRLSRDT